MEIDQEKIIAELEKQPTGVDEMLEERQVSRSNEMMSAARPVLFAWAMVLSVFLIAGSYFMSSFSRIRSLSVSGNNYLPQSYVERVSGISYDSRYFLVFPATTKKRLESDPMIATARVVALKNHAVQIEITENQPIGYRYHDDQAFILMADGSEVQLTSELMPVIARVPYINGFYEEQQTHLLARAFELIAPDIIEDMAEVTQYPMDYDDETIEIRMRDGMVFFAGYFTTQSVNQYRELASKLTNRDNCFFATQNERVVVAKSCPWDEPEVIYDYWTDEEGNIIRNRWGDKAIKHYYQDASGGYYLDETGNWIIIPIDAGGNDNKDPDFLDHYILGYYATGTLVIPEPEETPEIPEETEQPAG
ncbi:MAG: FtsQ-type POTRA domain-containing protein [Solobacterium sp.]|nr:FtsQ-type POTRA domain-containing protein [Solobacterium sp.]